MTRFSRKKLLGPQDDSKKPGLGWRKNNHDEENRAILAAHAATFGLKKTRQKAWQIAAWNTHRDPETRRRIELDLAWLKQTFDEKPPQNCDTCSKSINQTGACECNTCGMKPDDEW